MDRLKSAIKGFFDIGAETEEMFEAEIMSLLQPDFQIVSAARYTKSRKTFLGNLRTKKPPTDFLIIYKRLVIAAVEVTTGSKDYSYEKSWRIDIDEPKLERMDTYTAGFVAERILVGEPHFIWAAREDIRDFPPDEFGTHHTDIKIWKLNLDTLVKKFEELAKLEEDIL
jgi:hypothetical protein